MLLLSFVWRNQIQIGSTLKLIERCVWFVCPHFLCIYDLSTLCRCAFELTGVEMTCKCQPERPLVLFMNPLGNLQKMVNVGLPSPILKTAIVQGCPVGFVCLTLLAQLAITLRQTRNIRNENAPLVSGFVITITGFYFLVQEERYNLRSCFD